MPLPKKAMCLDANSIFRGVPSRSHLFNSCSTSGDNLFASVAINRGPFAAVSDALHYRWTISRPLIDCIRGMMEDISIPGDQERISQGTMGAGCLVASERFTGLLDRVLTA
jgi:hypothetical protein